METRPLGPSGLHVPLLSFGAGTFGGSGPLFGHWGRTDVEDATRMVRICLDAGITLFDTADVYSDGASESVLGAALRGVREQALISTKIGLPTGNGPNDRPNDWGLGRERLLAAVDAALQRLGTDHIDLLQLHAYDAHTPVDELLDTIDTLLRAGKIRHWGVSNYPGWALMQAIERAHRRGMPAPVAHQVYYSLVGRDYEWELMPLAQRAEVGALVWSPLGWGRLTGSIRRDRPRPSTSRLHATESFAPPVDDAYLYAVVDELLAIAEETGRSVPQVALNWLSTRPTVSSIIIGARDEKQLRDNLGAVGWQLDEAQRSRLDRVSRREPAYPAFPYYRQAGFAKLFAPPV